MSQLLDGFTNVVEGPMGLFLFWRLATGTPTPDEFLQSRNIDHSIVQQRRDFGHVRLEEFAVFPDGIAAERDDARGDVFFDERERLSGGLFEGGGGGADLIEESGAGMQCPDVVVHRGQYVFGLVDDDARAFFEDVEIRVRHDRCDLDDRAFFRVEPRHLEVDPDQPVR